MTAAPRPRVLCVDDEQHVLDALARTLRSDFDVDVALGGAAALRKLVEEAPYAVIVSDMRMPGMDGTAFLARAAQIAPDSVRVLLTGHGDLALAVEAVNRCRIFRFLLKPTNHDELMAVLHDAAVQHELVTCERVLLAQTLRGAVAALLEVLSLANPLVFARATRVRRIVTTLLPALQLEDGWSIEIAASLSQLGAVALPSEVVTKLDCGTPLTRDQHQLVDGLPALTEQLLATIPRLDAVRSAIRLQTKNFDGTGSPIDRIAGEEIPIGARLLKVAVDLDQLESLGFTRAESVALMTQRRGHYDPELMRVLHDLVRLDELSAAGLPRATPAAKLRPGMVLARDIIDVNGLLLVGRGAEVTPGLIARIRNVADRVGDEVWVTGGLHVAADFHTP
jgi:response regulator RpfG family c-di-GMP phosphodiesterase